MAADGQRGCVQQGEGGDIRAECGLDGLGRFRPADQQQAPGVGAVFHLGFGAVEKKFSQGLKSGLTNFTYVLDPHRVVQDKHTEIAQHFSLVGEKTGIAALARLEREKVVADDALEPLDAIVAGHAKSTAVRQVGHSDGPPHGGVFCCCIAIVSRHRPSGGFFERGAELLVVSLES